MSWVWFFWVFFGPTILDPEFLGLSKTQMSLFLGLGSQYPSEAIPSHPAILEAIQHLCYYCYIMEVATHTPAEDNKALEMLLFLSYTDFQRHFRIKIAPQGRKFNGNYVRATTTWIIMKCVALRASWLYLLASCMRSLYSIYMPICCCCYCYIYIYGNSRDLLQKSALKRPIIISTKTILPLKGCCP